MSLTVLHAPPPSPPLLLPPRWSLKAPAQALRTARTCYDHVAGRVGVDIMAAMIRRGQLTGGDGTFNPDLSRRDRRTGYGHDVDYTLTAQGQQFLADFGVQLPPRRPVIRYCIDWSEQRHHLAGALGRGTTRQTHRPRLGPQNRHQPRRSRHRPRPCGLHDTFDLQLNEPTRASR